MKQRRLILVLLVLILSSHTAGCAKRDNQKRGNQFEALRSRVLQGAYKETVPKLEKFIKDNPNSKQASRAGLFLFKCHFAMDNIEDARKWCQWTIDKHPQSLEANKCKFKLAMILLVEGKTEEARKEFEKLSKNPAVPQSPESKQMAVFLERFSIDKRN